ncbi:lysylphosphatidylglycerol synthase transmembrane domain-containing protein [Halorubrum halodurans]|uniref:TIGR00374 family protein n=1 Tax=Halorubrum halodurans TaxID=1383851 RepID=A0A256IHE2_9EURY|nr:lysylphosphatidylglycerol synthase transmembrane domain-containing protein [Halorubrum halodurans]OYR55950.1 TIGR00374 family protein [Halorubrum halodurans]
MSDERLRDRLSRGRLTLVGTVVVLALGVAVLARTVDADALLAAVGEADPRLLALALLAYLLSWPFRGRRYGDVLAPMDRRHGVGFLTAAVFASQTANLVVPARAGDGVRAYLLKRRRAVPYPTGVASLAVERGFDLVAIATLGGTALAALLLGDRSVGTTGAATPLVVAAGLAVAAVLLAVSTVALARSEREFGSALRGRVEDSRLSESPRLSGIVDAAVRFGAAVRVVAVAPRGLARVYVGSLLVWGLDVLTAVLVLAALVGGFAGEVPALTLVTVGTLAVSAGNLAKVLPLSQGGIGLYEAAFVGLVVGTTAIPVETAVVAAVLDHALKNVVTLGGGGVAALVFDRLPTAAPEEGEPATGEGDPSAAGPPDF